MLKFLFIPLVLVSITRNAVDGKITPVDVLIGKSGCWVLCCRISFCVCVFFILLLLVSAFHLSKACFFLYLWQLLRVKKLQAKEKEGYKASCQRKVQSPADLRGLEWTFLRTLPPIIFFRLAQFFFKCAFSARLVLLKSPRHENE